MSTNLSAASTSLNWLLAAAVSATIAAPLAAHEPDSQHQSPPLVPLGELVQRHVDSGFLANRAAEAATVHSTVIATPDAAWTRLYFSEISLDHGSRIRLTSLLDGEVQELDAAGAAMWGNTSAYFNGPMVQIELIAAPGTARNRFVLEQLGVEFGVFAIGSHCSSPLVCGLCNGDTRVPSNENWSCRLVSASGGCSAAIYNANSLVVSAGHCMGANMVIQFNVPQSNANCTINHPPANDQFPVTTQISANAGAGADWAVMTSGTNGLGQTAFDRFGEYRPIAAVVPSSGSADAWGYGVTDECTLRQTQQHSSGAVLSLTGSSIRHTADTTCGNSGSSVLHNGEIIGIASHCSWTCPPDGNTATRIDVPAFAAARASLEAVPEDVDVPGDYATIQAAIDAVAPGSTITVASGVYNEAINFIGKNLTVISADGPDVTVIDATGINSGVVRFSSNENSSAVLEGFTITGGTGWNVTIGGNPLRVGGGIYTSASTPTINNCIIVGNTAEFGGGVFNSNASPVFTDCVFESNVADPSAGGGAFNFSGAQPQYINTLFLNNVAGTGGGAMSSQSAGPLVIQNCQFINNTADTVGGAVRMIQSSLGTFSNSIFQFNTAQDNGGAFFTDASPQTTIAGSTFCENAPNHIAGAFTDSDGNDFQNQCPDPCVIPADLNCDGTVNVTDLLALFAAWGPCADVDDCPADLNNSGVVDVSDLLLLFASWG